MAEPIVVVMKRVTTVERRVGRLIKRKRETMSIHSYDGETWLMKLERISELSVANGDVVFNKNNNDMTARTIGNYVSFVAGKTSGPNSAAVLWKDHFTLDWPTL